MDVSATTFRTELPFTPAAPAFARDQVRVFARRVPPDTLDDAVLMVSELVTNAVQHGQPEVTLGMSLSGDGLTVSVSDQGSGAPIRAFPTAEQQRGRGLGLVDALASKWGVIRSAGQDGKQVWFRLATA